MPDTTTTANPRIVQVIDLHLDAKSGTTGVGTQTEYLKTVAGALAQSTSDSIWLEDVMRHALKLLFCLDETEETLKYRRSRVSQLAADVSTNWFQLEYLTQNLKTLRNECRKISRGGDINPAILNGVVDRCLIGLYSFESGRLGDEII